jgi:maltose O-acetyltransferase
MSAHILHICAGSGYTYLTMKKTLAIKLSLFIKTWFKLLYGNRIRFGKKTIINHRFSFKGKGKLIIGNNVNLWAHKEKNEFITLSKGALIEIGDGCRLNGLSVQCREHVSIGRDCLIGSALVLDTDYHSVHFEKRNDPDYIRNSPVFIKDRVWLAGQTAVLKGVTVGEEAVVGFRAVVTKDIAPKTIVAGNPAREVAHIEKP